MIRRLAILSLIFASFTILVSLAAKPALASGTAVFMGTDTATQGNWQAKYGTDGYYLANSVQSAPSYASATPQLQVNYTWTNNTSDPRALTIPSVGKIASAWYSTATFDLDVNVTDGGSHPVAIYLVDWDNSGRAETLQVVDASSNAILDTQSASSFGGGVYFSWTVSGHVRINVIPSGGPNAVVSGIFFGGVGGSNPETVTVSPSQMSLSAGGSQQFGATIANASNNSQTITWTISNVSPSAAPGGSISSTGFYNAPGSGQIQSATVTIKATDQDNVSGTATVTLTGSSGGGGGSAVVSYVGTDTTTQGSWQGKYGSDGYSIPNSLQSLPTYDPTFQVLNQANYTWDGNTTDPRAVVVPGGSRIASSWYSLHFSVPPTFSFDVNFNDGQSHLLALYALDWDAQGRAETIQIYDATSNTLLDTRSISNFVSGEYVLWTVSGHVTVNVTETVGTNCVISGVFFGGNAGSAINVNVSPATLRLPPGAQEQFSATVTNASNTAVNWSISPSNTGSIGASSGLYVAPAQVSGSQTVTVTAASAQNPSSIGNASVTVTTGGVANFLATDSTTQGGWQGTYGGDGYYLAGSVLSQAPSYGTFSVSGQQSYTWNGNSSDLRALQTSGGSRIAAAWYNSPSFSFNVNATDGKLHQFAIYALDWDNQGRAETIQIQDTASGAIIDSRSLSNFSNGTYLLWNIAGNITVNVILTGGPNAVVNGVFFGGGSAASVSVSPQTTSLTAGQSQTFMASGSGAVQGVTWSITAVTPQGAATGSLSANTPGLYTAPSTITVATTVTITATSISNGSTGTATIVLNPNATATKATFDTSTEGSWHGNYGADGYSLAGDTQQLPSYATLQVQIPNGTWVWTGSTTDPRALQNGANTTRLAAAWYKNHESFDFDVNFTDGQQHQLALYALDWDLQGRSETIQVVDAVTGVVLDTELISNFPNGVYVIWKISGHVTINVTVNSGANAVINGVFFK